MKKHVLLVILGASGLAAQQSVFLTPQRPASATLPNTAIYRSIGDFRIEFRVDSWSPVADYSQIIGLDKFLVRWTSTGSILFTSIDDPVPTAATHQSINVTGVQQFIVRLQRDIANRRLLAEAWNLSTGEHTVSLNVSFSSALAPVNVAGRPVYLGDVYTNCKLAYLKWFAGIVAPGTPPSAGRADLLDLEFEGTTADTAHGINFTGSAFSYAPTPLLPPVIVANTPYCIRAGTPAKLDAAGSFSPQGEPLTYLWSQISGPAAGNIESSATNSTRATGLIEFGSYVFRLTLSDGTRSAQKDYKIGAVITDDNDIVQIPDPGIRFVLGPLTRWGTSPWPWFDMTERAVAEVLEPAPAFHSGGTPLPGTMHAEHVQAADAWWMVCDDPAANPCNFASNFHNYKTGGLLKNIAVAKNVATVTIGQPHGLQVGDVVGVYCDSGYKCPANLPKNYPGYTITAVPSPTTFQFNTHRVENGQAYDVSDGIYSNAGMHANVANHLLAIWYDAPAEAPGTGKSIFDISEVVDNSHMWLYSYVVQSPITQPGHQYSFVDPVEASNWSNGNNNWNYYDGGVLASYRLYYRTGVDDHLAAARRIADLWWIYAMDHGNGLLYPRVAAITGMVMRALDGRPEMWPGIETYMHLFNNDVPSPVQTSFDPRESGYYLKYKALVAALAANANGTADPAARAAFCGYVKNEVNNLWAPNQMQNGSFPYDAFGENPDYPYAGPGMLPFQLGIGAHGLWYAYQALQDPAGCNEADAAQTALQVMGKALKFAYTQGVGKGRGAFYAVNFYAVPWYPDGSATASGAGTVTIAKGSRVVKGTNTKFRAYFFCDGKDYIGIYNNRKVYRVVSCDSDTQLTVDNAIPDAIGGSGYQLARTANTDCSPSVAAYCQPNAGDRSLLADMIMPFGAYYWATGDEQYRKWGDDLFSAGYGAGKSAGSYCQAYETPLGPGGDGGYAYNFVDACNYGAASAMGKGRGMTAGAGGEQGYLAYRISASDPACKDLTLSLSTGTIAPEGGAGTIAVTVTDQRCAWTATSAAGWLTITGASGTGNGTIEWSAQANPGSGRSGLITAGPAVFLLTQAAADGTPEQQITATASTRP